MTAENLPTDEEIHVELRPSPMNVILPFRFGSDEAERQIRDVIDAVRLAAWRDGVRVGVDWYIEHGGRPREIASITRKSIKRDETGQITEIVEVEHANPQRS